MSVMHGSQTTTVGERIRSARVSAGRTLEGLADSTGKSLRTVVRWERGDTSPAADDLIALGQALNVDPAWLLTGATAEAPA